MYGKPARIIQNRIKKTVALESRHSREKRPNFLFCTLYESTNAFIREYPLTQAPPGHFYAVCLAQGTAGKWYLGRKTGTGNYVDALVRSRENYEIILDTNLKNAVGNKQKNKR